MSSRVQSPPSSGGGSARSATRRLLKELEGWRAEQQDEKGIERLGPAGEDDLFAWEAVVNGKGIGSGYDGTSPKQTTFLFLLSPQCARAHHLLTPQTQPAAGS